jgi:hypothetical protein
MSLIDTSYFTGPIHIGGLSSQHVRAKIEGYIEEYEPQFLSLLFGDVFYAEYVAGLELEDNAIWTALQTEDLKKAIACYVYYYYMRDLETLTTSLGEQKPQTENSTQASGINKQVSAWNSMVIRVRKIYDYLYANTETYPTWDNNYQYGYYDSRSRWIRNDLTNPINTLNL